jgi:hypothetical protein
MSTSYYLPCDIEPSTLGCSVIDMERRGASKAAHDTFEIGEQMGRHLWNLATNRTVRCHVRVVVARA